VQEEYPDRSIVAASGGNRPPVLSEESTELVWEEVEILRIRKRKARFWNLIKSMIF
jgi:hypothetical protein